jgi:hypothetical protein
MMLEDVADDITRIQANLKAIHPEGHVKVHLEELARAFLVLIAKLESLFGAKSAEVPPKK